MESLDRLGVLWLLWRYPDALQVIVGESVDDD
jgi:hypothetical protein